MCLPKSFVDSIRTLALVASLMICLAFPGLAQAPKAPVPAPAPKKAAPATPASKAAPQKATEAAAAPAAPKPAPAADIRFKSKYTTGDQVTESVTYIKGARERYELADMILLRQHDQKRTVQISRSSKTYLVTPEGLPAESAP